MRILDRYDNLEQWFHWTFSAKYDIVGKVLADPDGDGSNDDDDDDGDGDPTDMASNQDNSSSTAKAAGATATSTDGGDKSKPAVPPKPKGIAPGSSAFARKLAGASEEEVKQMRDEFLAAGGKDKQESRAEQDRNPKVKGVEEFSQTQKSQERDLLAQFGAS